jgi:hypothetical protein
MKLLALLWMLLLASNSGTAPSATPAQPTARPSPAAPISPDTLFSRRALRRARLLIQMRMLQFRNERLDCVRAALLRQLPPALRPQEPTTWSSTASDACLRGL